MKRKIVPWFLVASLLFYIGCYNTEMVSKEGLKARVEQYNITVSTKDSLEYKFLKDNYRVQGDTLTGFGVRKSNNFSDIVLDASLPFADITSIETKEFSLGKTFLLCSGVGLGAALIIKILFTHDQPLMITPVTL
jgi:hypothetical protein